ncbi:glycosyltransferase [Zoogloea sp.]|uniref:glycosyltransferase n=1 Tax=Zoogloea sp. TaxID=49181 RepID=UPI0035B328DD
MVGLQLKAYPAVSVVIVNWNGEKFLERCLSALLAQTVKPNEIILLDNSSSDRSREIARRFPSVRLIEMGWNTGFAKGNNLAIRQVSAESEWIALINPDAFADRRWLECLLSSALKNSEFDVFGSKLVSAANSDVLDGAGDVCHVSGLIWRTAHGISASSIYEREREIFSPCAAAALYRRSALFEVDGFDEDFFCYAEDVDLGFRLRLAGYRCLYVPQSVVHHVGSGTTGGKNSNFSVYHGHRNLVWMFLKNMPGCLLWLFLPLHVVLNFISVLWFALRGQGGVILRAKRDAFLGVPNMWRKRKEIQRLRRASIGDIWRVLDKRFFPVKRKFE